MLACSRMLAKTIRHPLCALCACGRDGSRAYFAHTTSDHACFSNFRDVRAVKGKINRKFSQLSFGQFFSKSPQQGNIGKTVLTTPCFFHFKYRLYNLAKIEDISPRKIRNVKKNDQKRQNIKLSTRYHRNGLYPENKT